MKERWIYKTIKAGTPFAEERTVIFDERYDLIVCGCGTAGSIAAMTGAKEHLKVLAVETCATAGGTSVCGGVWPYYFGLHGGNGAEKNALAEELAISGVYATYEKFAFESPYSLFLPGATLARAIENKLREYGCTLRLKNTVTGVFTRGNTIGGVEIFDGKALVNVACDCLIDSADGHICRLAGCEMHEGRQSDGKSMLYSRYIAVAKGAGIHGSSAHCGYLDGCDGTEYTKRLLTSASSAPCLQEKYTRENIVVSHSAFVGRREVARVKTKKVATLENWFAGKTEQPIYYAFSHLDNANEDFYDEDEGVQDWNFLIGAHAYGLTLGVELDNLLVAEYENLFLAGKHIGVEHSLVGFVRMKADMERCGEVAAIIAGAYLKNGEVAYESIKPLLIEKGVLNENQNVGIRHLNYYENGEYRTLEIPRTVDGVRAALRSNEPELGYIGALRWLKGTDGEEELKNGLMRAEERENIAIALGLMGNAAAVRALEEILEKPATLAIRKDTGMGMYSWLSVTTHCNYAKALCLLIRFQDDNVEKRVDAICADGANWAVSGLPLPYREKYRKLILGFAEKYKNTVIGRWRNET